MKKQKGFISIIAAFVILVIGSAALYGYGQKTNKEIDQKFAGSVVASKYGGTGQSFGSASGLLRLTDGTFATTSAVTDAEVPDDITITSLPNEVNFATATVNYLSATTTVSQTLSVTGISTFSAIPTLPASNPTTDNQATRKAYVDAQYHLSTTTVTSKTAGTDYQNASGWRFVSVRCNTSNSGTTNSVASCSGSIGASTSTYTGVATVGQSTQGAVQGYYFQLTFWVPPNYYYIITTATQANSAATVSTWVETDSD